MLYGWHPVSEALANERRGLRRLLASENAVLRLQETFGEVLRIVPEIVRPSEIGRLLGPDAVHQGLYLEADPLPAPALDAMPADALLLALDQITDPHNVGAILRSAAAFDALGVVTQDRHAPPESGTLAKSASGALEVVPWVRVVNLSRALDEVAEAGYWRIGLDGNGPSNFGDAVPAGPIALVLGAEGEGMRHNVAQHCDALARLPISDAIESLNVSNAAAIALYAIATRS